MAKSAFKLKSGNISGGSSFKQMGSSPMKLGILSRIKKTYDAGKSLYNTFKYGSRYADEVSNIVTKGTNKMKPYTKKGELRKNFTNKKVDAGTSKMKSELKDLNPNKTTTRFKIARGVAIGTGIGSVIAKDGLDGSTVEVYKPEAEFQNPKTGTFSGDSIDNAKDSTKKYVPSTYE